MSVHGVQCRSRHGQGPQVVEQSLIPLPCVGVDHNDQQRRVQALQAQETKGPCLAPYLSAERGPRRPQTFQFFSPSLRTSLAASTSSLSPSPLFTDRRSMADRAILIHGENSRQNILLSAKGHKGFCLVSWSIMVDWGTAPGGG